MRPPLGALHPERRHLNLRWSVRDTDMIVGWWKEGYGISQIAARLDVSYSEVADVLREQLQDYTIN